MDAELAAISQTSPLASIRSDEWDFAHAAHLLERAGFGGTPSEVERLASMHPEDAVRDLVYYEFCPEPMHTPFQEARFYPPSWTWQGIVNAFAAMQDIPVPGLSSSHFNLLRQSEREFLMDSQQTGVTPELRKTAQTDKQAVVDAFFFYTYMDRLESARLQNWVAGQALTTRRPLQIKLAMFWISHFAVGNQKVKDYRKMKARFEKLRDLGNGKFGTIVLAMAQDPALLIYLDNQLNIKGRPNENFARELMELFTVGASSFTEDDVKEVARAFTGWGVNEETLSFVKRPELHDGGIKHILSETGRFDGEEVLELLLRHPSCADHISGRLHRYFVGTPLTSEDHRQLAASLRSREYNISEYLAGVFLSRQFYEPAARGTQIKSPIQFLLSTYKKLGLTKLPTTPDFSKAAASLGQELFFPPNVKGWDGGRSWITPASLMQRGAVLRSVLFPEGICLGTETFLEGSRRHSGEGIHEFFVDLARKGNFTEFPPARVAQDLDHEEAPKSNADATGSDGPTQSEFSLSRGVFNGAWFSHAAQVAVSENNQSFSITDMLLAAQIEDVSGAIDHIVHRFLCVGVTVYQRKCLVAFLEGRLGSSRIAYERRDLESHILEALYLVLCLPEYQLA